MGTRALIAAVAAAAVAAAPAAACPAPRASAAYAARVAGALAARQDAWGNRLLAARGGPTYAGASRFLAPLLLARTSGGRPLTRSGVYYVPFGMPLGAYGAGSVALHVADGSEIRRERADGPALAVTVGGAPFGSCLAQLAPAKLADGWLPILETRYRGLAQESFSARIGRTLTTFVRVDGPGRVRIGGLAARIVAWDGTRARPATAEEYAQARAALVDYWTKRLAAGAAFEVPERRVMDAERALLVQNLSLTWRYSMGNPYEEFSFPESVDNAQVLAEYGFAAEAASVLRTSLTRRPEPYANWKRGEKLVGAALYFRLTADRGFVMRVTPMLSGFVGALTGQLGSDGLLARERYSSDIGEQVYGLHSQAVVWQGLREIARVWAQTGRPALAAKARAAAARLETGLRRAVRASERRLPDGSLFVPVKLLDGERPYASVTESRAGSYWNLVMPYALASGLFEPGGREATGVLRYMLGHGSRLLGLVRAGAYALYGRGGGGSDQVYGLNVARFLADNDRPDQLVLSLYGQLAAGMTPGTFVAGEGATIAPLDGQRYRAMYLPPNSTSNGAFLETLRLLLVHETRGRDGAPRGLELAFATPRAWLAPGKTIAVRAAPTSFGPLSYELRADANGVHVSVDLPSRARPQSVRLRLRVPHATRMLDLSGRTGHVELTVATSGNSKARRSTASARMPEPKVRRWKIRYRAHNGTRRDAWVALPGWYGPSNHPPIPLVISPHGRGLTGRQNSRMWGGLPAEGPFAVVSPDGQGREFSRYSWGSPGQVEDLARMPQIVARTLPWVDVDPRQIFAFGGSMGGQETLLLLARHPRLLAGAAVFDSVVDFARQYRSFPRLGCSSGCLAAWDGPVGTSLQSLARQEVGGPPGRYPGRFAERSPMTYVHRIARSCVPLQVWWSTADKIVIDQHLQSERFFWALRRANPIAPVEGYVGLWRHSAEMRSKLPYALARFGLLPPTFQERGPALHVEQPPLSPEC